MADTPSDSEKGLGGRYWQVSVCVNLQLIDPFETFFEQWHHFNDPMSIHRADDFLLGNYCFLPFAIESCYLLYTPNRPDPNFMFQQALLDRLSCSAALTIMA